ncbi:MAG TPA: NAD(P)H-binding protein [Candidatus Limnocylindrales bacterium]|nr:NAD(P)H-binding protein [Candidatus Limnocylindrales bacterium]
MTVHRLVSSQLVRRTLDEVFPFFARPDNLARLTPPGMRFELLTADQAMRAGLTIDYRLRPLPMLPVSIRWRTRIESYDPPDFFSDVQARGPYRSWEHRHSFEAVSGGTLVRDEVEYELPLGPLGGVAHRLAVRSQLAEIFRFRARTIEAVFELPNQPPTGMTVAVAGGTGFVGGAIAREVRRRGHRVVVLSHRGEQARGPLPDDVEIRTADVADPASLTPALAGVDALVIALAIRNSPMESPRHGQTFELVDARGTERLVAAAREAGVGRLVYLSGAGAAPDAARHWFRAKWRAEEAVRASGLAWTIIRPTWIFGPRDVSLNRFLGFARTLPFVPMTNTGRQLLAPVFVDDAARLVADALTDPAAACQLFELGGPDVLSMREIIATALRSARIRRPILPGPTPLLKLAAWPMRLLPEPPLTPDAVDFVNAPAVVDTHPLLARMPRRLTPLGEALATYLAPCSGHGVLEIDGRRV